jgi:hypothetical protein
MNIAQTGHIKYIGIGIFMLLISCGQKKANSSSTGDFSGAGMNTAECLTKSKNPSLTLSDLDSIRFYTRLAHEGKWKSENYISDSKNLPRIKRPPRSYIKDPVFDVMTLYGIWGGGDEEPAADFEINAEIFHVEDYDGDADMSYILNKDSLFVFYPAFVRIGRIMSSSRDSLKINWGTGKNIFSATYKRWE